MSKSIVTIHMVSSLDGIIAKPDNSVSWFDTTDHYEQGAESEGNADFFKSIDCFVMGANTYEHAFALSKEHGWAYGDVPTVVLTHRQLPVDRSNIRFYAGDLAQLVNQKLKPKYRSIWMVGGAILTAEFMRLRLVDEIRLSILPVVLGEGKLFFDQIGVEQRLHLKNVTAYKSGMVELWYELVKGTGHLL